MSPPKIFVYLPTETTDQSQHALENAGCEVVFGGASWHAPQDLTEDDLCALTTGAHALMGATIRSSPVSRKVLKSSDVLRIVAKYTIGVDDIDLAAATEMGILVTYCPTEVNWGGVAEGTIAMMLTLLKKTRERDAQMKAGQWRDRTLEGSYLGAREDGYPGITIGIIGLGNIGSRVMELLAPWRVTLLGCDPHVDGSRFAHHDLRLVDLPTLLTQSDVVTVHVTLTEETRHLIGAAELGLVKPTAVLINTSRGQTIDEAALCDALDQGRIAAAALDVFENEPLPMESPLRRLGNNVLLSPHMVASNEGSGLGPGVEWATRSVLAAFRGELPDNVFNKEAIPKWQERFATDALLKVT